MNPLDPQTVEEVARSPWLPGVLGAIVAVRSAPGATWPERLVNILCGALISGFASPALSEYFGMTTQAMQSAMAFAVGLFGLNVVASITAWTKAMKVEDFLPWKRKGNDQ
jgi:hypothetical protein